MALHLQNLSRRAGYFFYRFRDMQNRIAQIEAYMGNAVATNRQTAKLALAHGELRGTWRRLGHWPGYQRARAIVSHQDKLYVGVGGGSERRAAVHAFNGEWRLAGGLGVGWSHGAEVHTLCVHDDLIHAGVLSNEHGAQLWRSDGQAWEQIGHWPDYVSVASLASYKGRLFAGLVSADKRDTTSPIVAYDGQWMNVSRSLGGYQCAYDLHVHDGALYAAMLSHGWPGGHVWRIVPEPELIGGTGVRKSWKSLSVALRLRSVGKHLVVALNREPPAPGRFYNAWAFDGEAWEPLPLFPDDCARLYSFNALAHFRGKVIVGCGGHPAGLAGVLALDESGWQLMGGRGVNNSWSPKVFRRQCAPLTYLSATELVYQLCEHQGDLIAGFGVSPGCAQVWRFSPTIR